MNKEMLPEFQGKVRLLQYVKNGENCFVTDFSESGHLADLAPDITEDEIPLFGKLKSKVEGITEGAAQHLMFAMSRGIIKDLSPESIKNLLGSRAAIQKLLETPMDFFADQEDEVEDDHH